MVKLPTIGELSVNVQVWILISTRPLLQQI